ncbi:MAG: hypothetical protein ACREPZ_06405 [Rhodanobacteraceae bacterium]
MMLGPAQLHDFAAIVAGHFEGMTTEPTGAKACPPSVFAHAGLLADAWAEAA